MGILARQQEAGPSFTPAPIQLRSPVPSKDYIKTVPALVEYNADRNANHPFCVQIRKNGQSPAERLLTVTHGELKDAVTRCQEWLLQNVAGIQLPSHRHDGRIQKGAPVALFMESDVGLWIYVVALMGLGVSVSESGCLVYRIPICEPNCRC
jgi:acyl-CoA synthetase (AMP-forming)/AMP-acid ligase II